MMAAPAAFADPVIVNSNFGAVLIVCSIDYAYQGTGGCTNRSQDFNTTPGFGWTLGPTDSGYGSGLTGPDTDFDPPPFTGLPFTQAVLLQDQNSTVWQAIGGFSPGSYTLSFYLGSRYINEDYDGNQTVEALIDGNVIGTWALSSFTPFTLETASFTVSIAGTHTLEFMGVNAGDHTAFLSGVSIAPAGPAYTVIHNFTGGRDGANPPAGLTIDAAGNFYGTTNGAAAGNGTVFKLKHYGSGWVLNPLYDFTGGNDGANPLGRVALAQDGTLYGTTLYGGQAGVGIVFHLTPSPTAPKSALAPWNETVTYPFTGGSDGGNPLGDLIFDSSGNIYGTTTAGGTGCAPFGCGLVYELTPSGGGWTQTVLYSFQANNGANPVGGVVFDNAGNLYGVLYSDGPQGYGAVYELSPSGSGWTEESIYTFTGGSDGANPTGGLIIDASGNLYGTTFYGGAGAGGTAFELTPANGGGWSFNTLYGFSGSAGSDGKLVMDAAGSLYGTTVSDGAYGYGSVFKLTPSSGGWTYTSLHDFTGSSDGEYPMSSLVFDASGDLYGTASAGGTYGWGVVFEITP